MRLLFASSSGSGHFLPLVPWIDAAVERGHEVLVLGPTGLAPSASAYPNVCGAEPDPAVVGSLWGRLEGLSPEESEAFVIGEIFTRSSSGALLPTARSVVADFRPDVVVRDPMEFASGIAAAEHGVPQVRVALGLASVDSHIAEIAGPVVEEMSPGSFAAIAGSPYPSRWPASLDAASFPVHRFRLKADTARFSADWGDPGWPLVYLTFGTEAAKMGETAAVFAQALAAVADLPLRVLLTVGRDFDIASLGEVPPHVRVEAWADQGAVLAQAAAVLHHGGSGTTLGAMVAGCPQVVFPLFADQPANARAIAASGLGVGLHDPEGSHRRAPTAADVPALRKGIEAVLAVPAYRERSLMVALELATLPTLEDIAAQLLPGW